jgi:hypothetical protein
VASRSVQLDRRLRAVRPQLVGESLIAGLERVLGTGVHPHRLAGERARIRRRGTDDVVALEVLGVVERAGRGLGAGLPQRRTVPSYGTEPSGTVEGEVEGAEAAHGDPGDCDPIPVPVVAVSYLRDHLVDHVVGPLGVGSVVPVRVVPPVGEGDERGPVPELCKGGEELVDLLGILIAVSSVEEDEHRPLLIPIVAGRQHHVHRKAAADRLALDREVLDGRAGGVWP